jgi:hypothetical protein
VLLRLAYLGLTNTFAMLRLLPMTDQDKDREDGDELRTRELFGRVGRWKDQQLLERLLERIDSHETSWST